MTTAVVHVAGPFTGPNKLAPLEAAIAEKVPIYVDVSDPIEHHARADILLVGPRLRLDASTPLQRALLIFPNEVDAPAGISTRPRL